MIERPIFSYGLSDKAGGLESSSPTVASAASASPSGEERARAVQVGVGGGQGINVHHKFVSPIPPARQGVHRLANLAPSGENGNGDHLLMIEDPRIATAYAIEALRVFDHLHFRSTMQDATELTPAAKKAALTLRKPRAISGKAAWFEAYYVVGSQKMKDRQLFAG